MTDEPNQYLSASIDVDESVVLWLIGDIGGATELAQRGAIAATEIGWSRGSVAARANLACLYVSSGRLSDAHEQVRRAQQERFSSVSTTLALADTTARALMADERFDEAQRLITSVLEEPGSRPWYRLSAQRDSCSGISAQGRLGGGNSCRQRWNSGGANGQA